MIQWNFRLPHHFTFHYTLHGKKFPFVFCSLNDMAGGNEAQRSDRKNCQKIPDDNGECHVFRQVEAVTALRFVPTCHLFTCL
jgi:hypothetical protein